MTFKVTVQDAHQHARRVMVLISNVHKNVLIARTELAVDLHGKLVTLPAMARQFKQDTDKLIADGYGAAVLAPIIADIYNYGDVSAFVADFNTLRTNLETLQNLIVTNATELRHSMNAQGYVEYDQPLTAQQKTVLDNALLNIVNLFE